MLHIDLFSGIGGFSLAVDNVFGRSNHIFCEVDSFCQQVLSKHWPESTIHGDIKTFLHQDEYSTLCPDILTGGFPCQPFSHAGKRKGANDDRHLWPEMLRVIRTVHPRWVIAENVYGITTWDEGVVFEQVCSDLESEGYEVQSFIIPACAVGAPHRRDRVWFVANSTGDRWKRGRSGIKVEKRHEEESTKSRQLERGFERPHCVTSDTDGNRLKGANELQQRRPSDWWSGEDDWYEVATRTCRVFNGLSRRLDEDRQRLNDGIYFKYASEFKEIKKQDLPHLWKGFQSKTFQWKVGRFNTLQNEDYLFSVLWKFSIESETSNYLSFESKEVQAGYVQNLWCEGKSGRSSQRWRYNEQYFQQHRDRLSQLSYEVASVAAKIKDWYETNRKHRLKSLGNAIVPQVAMQLMSVIKQIDYDN